MRKRILCCGKGKEQGPPKIESASKTLMRTDRILRFVWVATTAEKRHDLTLQLDQSMSGSNSSRESR